MDPFITLLKKPKQTSDSEKSYASDASSNILFKKKF